MNRILGIALGVVASMGGFVDADELVFNTGAGARFGYALLWILLIGIIGVIAFGEMSGRVSVVTRRPLMGLVRERFGLGMGLVTLLAEQGVILLTVAAQVGGLALVLQILFASLPFRFLLAIGGVVMFLSLFFLPFDAIERVFGYVGVALIVYWVTAIHNGPDWHDAAHGLIPKPSFGGPVDTATYWFFALGVLGAALLPFKLTFFSSGAIEEGWTPDKLYLSRDNAIYGFALGGLMSAALIFIGAQFFHPDDIQPEFLGSIVLAPQIELGRIALIVACVGMFFAIAGAASEALLSAAYNWAQFFGWEWGLERGKARTRKFTLTWMGVLAAALLIVGLGANPIILVEFAVPLSVIGLPLCYLATLVVARDEGYMGEYANGRLANTLGWVYLALTAVFAVAAIPLLIATNHGTK